MAGTVRRHVLPDLFDWAHDLPGPFGWPTGLVSKTVRVEEFLDENKYVIRAELPGMDPEKDIKLSATHGVLTIHAERKEQEREGLHTEFHYGSFTRRVPLPTGAKEEEIGARYDAGILEIFIPMNYQQPEVREIPIDRT